MTNAHPVVLSLTLRNQLKLPRICSNATDPDSAALHHRMVTASPGWASYQQKGARRSSATFANKIANRQKNLEALWFAGRVVQA
jgi:hypothetical protein